MRGAVAGGVALNPSHLRLGTPADDFFAVVEGRWSPLCNEASNLWSVRDPCPSLEHMALESPNSRLIGLQKVVSVWEKMGLRGDSEILDNPCLFKLCTGKKFSNRAWGKGRRSILWQAKDDSAY